MGVIHICEVRPGPGCRPWLEATAFLGLSFLIPKIQAWAHGPSMFFGF